MLMLMMLTFYDDADDGDVLTTLISVQIMIIVLFGCSKMITMMLTTRLIS